MNNLSKYRTGVFFSILSTGLPFLGLIKQLIKPTGDKIVIIVLGMIVTVFFLVSLVLLYISLDQERFIRNRKVCRGLAWSLLFYPFIGVLPSVLILNSVKERAK